MNADYSYEDIVNALLDVGLKTGDNVFVHSNIGFFGRMKDGNTPEDYCRSFKKAIFEVIGEEGTLIVPTFSYSFCWGQEFNVNITPGTCGFFSEFIRNDPTSLRLNDPNFSISAIGKNALIFTNIFSPHSFGSESFWEKFYERNGVICNFNLNSGFSTMIHYFEKENDVFYRFDKGFKGLLKYDNMEKEVEFFHFVYDYNFPEHAPEINNFHQIALFENKVKISNLGKGQVIMIKAIDMGSIIKKYLKIDPYFLTKKSKILNSSNIVR